MDKKLVKEAQAKISSIPVLVNLVSKRMRQLIEGARPLVMPKSADEDKCDIALREIAEGKLMSEVDFDAIDRAEEAKTKWTARASLKAATAG